MFSIFDGALTFHHLAYISERQVYRTVPPRLEKSPKRVAHSQKCLAQFYLVYKSISSIRAIFAPRA